VRRESRFSRLGCSRLGFFARVSVSASATAGRDGKKADLRFDELGWRDSHLQAAAVVDGGLQGYPGDKDPVVPVDAVTLAYIEAEGLSRSFDYLDEVNGVLGILKQRSRTRRANFLNSRRRNISQGSERGWEIAPRAKLPPLS